jgi:hypothetical protein
LRGSRLPLNAVIKITRAIRYALRLSREDDGQRLFGQMDRRLERVLRDQAAPPKME